MRGRASAPSRGAVSIPVGLLLLGCAACAVGSDPIAGAGGEDSDGDAASVGGVGGNASVGATNGSGGGSACVYPSGETGVLEGMLVDGSLSWQGFPAGASSPTTVAATDFFDCDGSRGVDAILVVQSATWCGPCQAEAAKLEGKMGGAWAGLGIRVLTLMVEDANESPATVDTASAWKNAFGLTSIAVAADPAFSFDYFNYEMHISGGAFPTQLVVDPRTMKIVVREEGDLPLDAQLEQLAEKNKP